MPANGEDNKAVENGNPTMEPKEKQAADPPAGDAERPPVLQGWDRFLTRGSHAVGKMGILSLGHTNVVEPGRGDAETPWMDEHAVRIRAGLLNALAWCSLLNVFYIREPKMAYSILSLAMWEFLTSCTFGLTPLAPLGVLGTCGSMILYKEPLWVPARPKRFAWVLGLVMVTCCMVFWRIGWEHGFKDKHDEMVGMGHHRRRALQGDDANNHGMAHDEMNATTSATDGMDKDMNPNMQTDSMMNMECAMFDMNDLSEYPLAAKMRIAIKCVVFACLVLTWLESSCGWCMGCCIYKLIWKTPKHGGSATVERGETKDFHCDPSLTSCEVCERI